MWRRQAQPNARSPTLAVSPALRPPTAAVVGAWASPVENGAKAKASGGKVVAKVGSGKKLGITLDAGVMHSAV